MLQGGFQENLLKLWKNIGEAFAYLSRKKRKVLKQNGAISCQSANLLGRDSEARKKPVTHGFSKMAVEMKTIWSKRLDLNNYSLIAKLSKLFLIEKLQ